MPLRFPQETLARLDMAEGTTMIRYAGQEPLPSAGPPTRLTLIADTTPLGSQVRIDVDRRMRLYWVRQVPGGKPGVASVDISPLAGATRLDIWCRWSPVAMEVRVVDRDHPERLVNSEGG